LLELLDTGGAAVIDPAAGSVRRDRLADPGSMEFPRVDRRIGRPRGVIALGTSSGRHRLVPGDHDALLWLDTTSGRTARWDAGDLAVEPVFVPRPGDANTAHGWWATFAIDRTDRTSWFLVIPATDPAAGPIARVRIPVRVPLGLHGAWLPTEEGRRGSPVTLSGLAADKPGGWFLPERADRPGHYSARGVCLPNSENVSEVPDMRGARAGPGRRERRGGGRVGR
jgi:carotenoid cleavage dioxygenase